MKVNHVVLSFYAALFITFGIIAHITPALLTNALNIQLQAPAANIEFMATYGGLFLGLGLFMLYCTKNHRDLGLICVLLTMGSMLLSRVSGAFIFSGVDVIQTIYISGELFTLFLISALLYNSRHSSHNSSHNNSHNSSHNISQKIHSA